MADRSPKSPQNRVAMAFALALVLAGSMGASCTPRAGSPFFTPGPQAPVVLTETSTAADIVAAVNANTARVQTYQAERASLSMPGQIGLPLLSSNIAVERPNRFRLRAVTAITGPEVDLGSNDQRFWVWARRNDPPGVYTARHDQFAASPARAQLPVDPSWLVEALGLPVLDPAVAYEGPFPQGDGTVEIRSRVTTPSGPVTRLYRIDNRTAQVREQQLYDASGSLVASVVAGRFAFDPVAGVSLPEQVEVRVPAAQMALRINTGPIVVNAPMADGGQLWQMPQLNGYPVVDLAAASAPVAAAPAGGVWDLGGSGAASPWSQAPPIAERFGAGGAAAPAPTTTVTPAPTPAATPWRAATTDRAQSFGRVPAQGVALGVGR